MKRVLHLTAQYPDKTGSGTYLKAILKQGERQGLEQALVYAINEGDTVDLSEYRLIREYVIRFKTGELSFPVVGMSDNMPYESTKYSEMTEDMLRAWKSAFLKKIRLAISEFKPDVVYSHHLWLLTAILVNELDGPTIKAFGHGTDLRQFKMQSLDTDYIAKGCRDLNQIFALTDYQKREISKCYKIPKSKISVLGAGFDMDIFNICDREVRGVNSNQKKIIYAGKLCHTKGVKSLLRVYGRISEDVQLIIAGSGEISQRAEIEDLAKSIDRDIRFVGHISQRELSKLFKSSDIFVLPSFYEGLALVNIEALASGLRVVSTDIDGIRDYMGEVINKSGLIEYVELPKEDSTGDFSKEELLKYEDRLKRSIELQLSRREIDVDLSVYHSIRSEIESKSWDEVFKKI